MIKIRKLSEFSLINFQFEDIWGKIRYFKSLEEVRFELNFQANNSVQFSPIIDFLSIYQYFLEKNLICQLK